MNSDYPEFKRALKRSQKVELPMDDAFFDKLHDRIMAEVEKTEIKPASFWDKPRKLLRVHWKGWSVSGASVMVVLMTALHSPSLVRSLFDQSHTVQVVRNEDAFAQETVKSPSDFSETLISYQTESDFFVDVAERSFHDLSQEHVREIMGEAGP